MISSASRSPLRGVLAPVVTPFKADLSPDPERLVRHCNWLQSQGCALAVFGTNSEANSLSVEERMELLDSLLVAGIAPDSLLPGTGCCSISDSVRLTRHAVSQNVAGVLMLPPFYYKQVSDEGVFRSFAEVIERTADARLRLFLYHFPAMTQVPIRLGLIERLLAAYPDTVVGIKDSSGDADNLKAMLQAFPGLSVFAGSESLLLENLRHGGAGCISATANVNPAAIHHLYANWRAKNSQVLQDELDKLRKRVERFPMVSALKALIAHFTRDAEWGRLRPPLVELDVQQRKDLIDGLSGLRIDLDNGILIDA